VADGATAPNSGVYKHIEGMTPFGDLTKYGGGDDDDDSGVIRHVSIRYGGYVIGDANEINGLTMGAVGRGTTIEHVEVFQNKDDGFEFFGGTVNTKYLVNWANGDDSFDWDEGFRGKGQFWLTVQGPLSSESDKSDKGGELDGSTTGDNRMPSSIGTVYNATMVGLGKGTGLKNTALHFRDGTGGRFYNSVFMDFGGACALIEGDPASGTHSSGKMTTYDYANVKPGVGEIPTQNGGAGLSGYIGYDHETGGKMLEIKNCVFWKFGYTNAYGCVTNATHLAEAYGAERNDAKSVFDGNKFHLGLDTGYSLFAAGFTNVYLDEASHNAPVVALERGAGVVIGSTTYYPVTALEPNLPAGSPYLSGGRAVPDDGFYTSVAFKGAFNDTKNWASWTLAGQMALIDWDESIVLDDYDDPFIQSEHLTYSLKFVADNSSMTYKVQWKAALTDPSWTELTSITGKTGEQTYTDTRELAGSGFYKVTKN